MIRKQLKQLFVALVSVCVFLAVSHQQCEKCKDHTVIISPNITIKVPLFHHVPDDDQKEKNPHENSIFRRRKRASLTYTMSKHSFHVAEDLFITPWCLLLVAVMAAAVAVTALVL